MCKKNFFLYFLFFLILFFNLILANAKNQTGVWTGLDFDGDFANGEIKYLFYNELRFLDHGNYFQNANNQAGLGYQIFSTLSLWAGYQYFTSNQITNVSPEKIVWQQGIMNIYQTKTLNISLRTRMEERERVSEKGKNFRLREKVTLSFPKYFDQKITPIIFDEVFYNLNEPSWIADDKTLSQNRAFIGVDIPILKGAKLQIGYLNQLLFRTTQDIMNNILYAEIYQKFDF